ncbi:hypothetical protein K461DRAFT_293108 [Myriangium duriaei CBS 260.36]|uniref:EKC/KEOPS complex subunit GON7 n=1 Tax=Myriangium duriaei CBS 260.36 TaxID=1168546 RepID=A0A9P4J778_9PEZI|nr:hypothetical protein K461DRAFT_293108 [Myriangium duriaei CBS 260.36]
MEHVSANTELTANYSSPTGHKQFVSPLSSLVDANRSTSDKTAYLSDLRTKVTQLQDDINAFLTDKMAEDQAAEAAAGVKKNENEDKEEDMYGEEDPENDG